MKILTPEELPRLRSIGHQFTADAKLPHPFNETHFENIWRSLITHGFGVILYEDDEHGKILGALAFLVNPDTFSGVQTASETFLYVLPEARGSGLASRLLVEFEKEAKSRNCKEVLMVSLSELETGPIFVRRGYKVLETIYRKEI